MFYPYEMQNTPIMSVADIRKRAIAARVTINQLTKKAGVSNTTIWRWEREADCKPNAVTMGKIEDALAWFEAAYVEGKARG